MVTKKAGLFITRQDKFRRDKESGDTAMKRGRVSDTDTERARWVCHIEKRYQATWQSIDKKYGLI